MIELLRHQRVHFSANIQGKKLRRMIADPNVRVEEEWMPNPDCSRENRRMGAGLLFILIAVCSVCGCDPGVNLRPEGEVDLQREWTKTFGDLEITSWGMGGLVGENWAGLSIRVWSPGTQGIVIKEAQLLARGKTFRANFITEESSNPSIAPAGGQFQRLRLDWKLDDAIGRLCADGCMVILGIERGGKEREIRLELKNYGARE
jgi:hypothetical protein